MEAVSAISRMVAWSTSASWHLRKVTTWSPASMRESRFRISSIPESDSKDAPTCRVLRIRSGRADAPSNILERSNAACTGWRKSCAAHAQSWAKSSCLSGSTVTTSSSVPSPKRASTLAADLLFAARIARSWQMTVGAFAIILEGVRADVVGRTDLATAIGLPDLASLL